MFFSVFAVALLAEGVDRNTENRFRQLCPDRVALLAEGVDRNNGRKLRDELQLVALLAEGVDRNTYKAI